MKKQNGILFLDGENSASVARRVASVLVGGGICIIPTDTIYGIVAIDGQEEAVKRIYTIKGRPRSKPLIRLIGSLEVIATYSSQPVPEEIARYWPGPLTVIVRGVNEPTVSIRYPSSSWLDLLFCALNYRVLVAPSANLSGRENIFSSEAIIDTFRGVVDLIVCAKGGLQEREPSTIVDISEHPWRIVREGALNLKNLTLA
jgi:L-threonylcarbamoyladenylate synthase